MTTDILFNDDIILHIDKFFRLVSFVLSGDRGGGQF